MRLSGTPSSRMAACRVRPELSCRSGVYHFSFGARSRLYSFQEFFTSSW